ncbi:MAG: aminotransferase class V-fold PLP-dependent enzyme [Candidatus Moranbacteria bacterium]|nr:aminotransferase class V-fold PLP-dependent enzyme [Candidatus Moranbacteria bacterium]
MKINPKKLFLSKIHNYQVETSKLGVVRYVNLDNAATTPPFRAVQKKVDEYLSSYGSVHRGAGIKSKISTDIYEKSRDVIKKFVNAPKSDYVVFTGNTTGAMNAAAHYFSFLEGKVAVSGIEHSSSWLPWIKAEGIKKIGKKQFDLSEMDNVSEKIQKEGRKQVVQYDVNNEFEFDLKSIENILSTNKIKAFVLTASSNATGYCPDIKKIGEIVHKHGAYFIVDACQFIQHHKIDMQKMGIDFLAASGHKFYAPYGGGFLIGPKNFFDKFISYEIGGGNLPYITKEGEFLRYKNQLAHDPGTPNAVGAVSMMYALEELRNIGIENIESYEKKLTKKAFDYLKSNPKIELYVSEKHLNTVLPFNIKGMNSKKVAERLNSEFGIGVRYGSFCVYNVIRKLLRIEDEKEIIENIKNEKKSAVPGFIRASFSLCNTNEDVERFILAIKEITKR